MRLNKTGGESSNHSSTTALKVPENLFHSPRIVSYSPIHVFWNPSPLNSEKKKQTARNGYGNRKRKKEETQSEKHQKNKKGTSAMVDYQWRRKAPANQNRTPKKIQ